jgi:dolichol-phosphate mannosyltransferase
MKFAIVTPVANESDTIDVFLNRIENVRKFSHHQIVSYFIFDKMSKDDTRAKIESRGSSNNVCIYHEKSDGLVSCYVKGYETAISENADVVIEMDAGLSHDPDLLPKFISAFESGYDACLGNRFSKEGEYSAEFHRRFVSFFGGKLVNLLMGSSFGDPTSGFEGFRVKTALSHINFSNIHAVGGMFQPEIKVRALKFNPGTTIYTEVPINYVQSTSSFKLKWVLLGLKSLWKIFLELRIGKASNR